MLLNKLNPACDKYTMVGKGNLGFTSGGKGNRGRFLERDKRICAAGDPTAQPNLTIADGMQQYLLKDEVDALISDAIIPPTPRRPLFPMREPPPPDMRHGGPHSELATLVNPPNEPKFNTLVNDIKETIYKSYWKAPLGKVPDPVPTFPAGYDIENTTFGKSTSSSLRLYDVIMPKVPFTEKTPPSKQLSAHTDRKYCRPAFNPEGTFGYRTYSDRRGILMKDALTDDAVLIGTSDRNVIRSNLAVFQEKVTPLLGTISTPNDNISCVPEGFSFGILTEHPENFNECLTPCKYNTKRADFLKCLAHLNTLRKSMSTRFLPSFFKKAYLDLKYYDPAKMGWIPKDRVYNYCLTKMIRFDAQLMEPLLACWDAFDGSNINYSKFLLILNFKQPLPDFPKVEDVDPECLDYRTTYGASYGKMWKPGHLIDYVPRAGLPSGRYLDSDYPVTPDLCVKAARECLPQESDMRSCLNPSVLTRMNISHRDMYERRDKATVRRVFEAAGDVFSEESFNRVWEEAQKLHSLGWVCYETFRTALDKLYPFTMYDD